jgi:Fic family protein
MNLEIINKGLLADYLNAIPQDLASKFDGLQDAEISTETFSFYTSVASVFSSKIEGENIELDSFIKHKRYGAEFIPDYTQKIDDLYSAYIFAKTNELNSANVITAHQLLSSHFVAKQQRGKFRTQNMYVTTSDGKIEYVAASPYDVALEMERLFKDIALLIKLELSVHEVFFFAAMIHLVFVKIHPWIDGNGRSARLIEKWFLAQKLGDKSWYISSERFYYDQYKRYYHNIRLLGLEYDVLDYGKALPFLLMLPSSLG